jgi:hypothetical protein
MIIKQSGGITITKLSQPWLLGVGRGVGRSWVRPSLAAQYIFCYSGLVSGWMVGPSSQLCGTCLPGQWWDLLVRSDRGTHLSGPIVGPACQVCPWDRPIRSVGYDEKSEQKKITLVALSPGPIQDLVSIRILPAESYQKLVVDQLVCCSYDGPEVVGSNPHRPFLFVSLFPSDRSVLHVSYDRWDP